MSQISVIKIGSVFTRFSVGKVVGMSPNALILRNTEGLEWSIDKPIAAKELTFAEPHANTYTVNRTEMIDVLVASQRTAMTLVFHKKPTPETVGSLLEQGKGDLTQREWKNKVKAAIEGEERTMVGYHRGEFDAHQRLKFTEIDGQDGISGHRLVDPRTLTHLTVNDNRYVLK